MARASCRTRRFQSTGRRGAAAVRQGRHWHPAIGLPSSVNETVPVGVPELVDAGVTVAVSVTGWPASGLATDGVTVSVVGIRVDDLGQDPGGAGAEQDVTAVGRRDGVGSDGQARPAERGSGRAGCAGRQGGGAEQDVTGGEGHRPRRPRAADAGVTTAVSCTCSPKGGRQGSNSSRRSPWRSRRTPPISRTSSAWE